jgi:hypothetical protein
MSLDARATQALKASLGKIKELKGQVGADLTVVLSPQCERTHKPATRL